MDKSKLKQLRDFIESHEMEYFVQITEYSGQAHIKKAFKVKLDSGEYWVHFSDGNRPVIKDPDVMFETMDKAKDAAKKWREEQKKKKKEEDSKYEAMMETVTQFLLNFSWYDFLDRDFLKIKPNGKPLAIAIKRVYQDMPDSERDDDQIYTKILENYIKHGTIYTQGIAFRKDSVVSVKYGSGGAVEIELNNGTTIIPKSKNVTNLIKAVFGDRLDTWHYEDVKKPDGEDDKITFSSEHELNE